MPRFKSDHVPTYRLHKSTGRAVVTLNGRDWPLGEYDTPDSKQRYHALIARWLAGNRAPLNEAEVVESNRAIDRTSINVNDLLDARKRQLEKELPEATLKAELGRIGGATAHLRELYGTSPACSLSPLKLKAVRERVIQHGYVRKTINHYVRYIIEAVKWAASEEMISASIYEALMTVEPLKRRRSYPDE
ncbi:MAG TPA: hypothetical protein PK402_03230 [Tepidisphaeraceae bacterium]|nr:hypothetical protein [Tepidisphaeraceae bacterium]